MTSYSIAVGPLTITADTLGELDAAVQAARNQGFYSSAKALVREYEDMQPDAVLSHEEVVAVLTQANSTPLSEPMDIAQWNRDVQERPKNREFVEVSAAKVKKEGQYKVDPRFIEVAPDKPQPRGLSV